MNDREIRLSGLLLYYAAKARQRPKTTMGLSTLCTLLDLDEVEIVEHMPAILDRVRTACSATWSSGTLTVYLTADDDQQRATVDRILDYWIHTIGKDPARTKKSRDRQSAVTSALRRGDSEDEIRSAIRGCKASDWHMQRGHNEIAQIVAKRSRVERHMQNDPKAGAIQRASKTIAREQQTDDDLARAVLSEKPDRQAIVALLRDAHESTRQRWLRSAAEALRMTVDQLSAEVAGSTV